MTVTFQNAALFLKEIHDRLMNVATEGVLVHGFRSAHTMHENVWYMVLSDEIQHRSVEKPSRDVVDDVSPQVHAFFRDVFPKGVNGDDRFWEFLADGFKGRDEPFLFLLLCGDGIVGPGGASADVNDVGTLLKQLFAMVERFIHVVVSATVGERVRRDVEDAHNGRVG